MVGTAHEAVTGPSAPDDTEVPYAGRPPALRGPALVVLGIAVLIVVVGLVGAALASGPSGAPPKPAVQRVTLADGSTVSLTPGSTALRSLVYLGQPPSDILGHLVVPAGSRPTGTVDDDASAESYDRTASFATATSGDDVIGAYKTALPELGWQVIYSGAGMGDDRSGTEVLAKRGSSDGYDWEVGVVVSPTTAAGTTPFSVEVFELADDDT